MILVVAQKTLSENVIKTFKARNWVFAPAFWYAPLTAIKNLYLGNRQKFYQLRVFVLKLIGFLYVDSLF